MGSSREVMYRKKMRSSDKRDLWVSRVIIWVAVIIALFPAVWVFSASFSKGESFFMDSIFPKEFGLNNYVKLFTKTNFVIWLKYSMIVCVSVSIIQIIQTTLAAYAFSRMRFYGRKYGLMTVILIQIFPSTMAIAAIYSIVDYFNLIGNVVALILVLSGGSAYNIWLLKGYMDRLPRDYDEAAFIDGANHFQVFTRIVIPLAIPMIVVIFIFSFIGVYSDFVVTSIVMQTPEKFTVAVGLRTFIDGQFTQNWTQFSAGAVVSSLPIMIVFMLLQKYIQSGLAAGGIRD